TAPSYQFWWRRWSVAAHHRGGLERMVHLALAIRRPQRRQGFLAQRGIEWSGGSGAESGTTRAHLPEANVSAVRRLWRHLFQRSGRLQNAQEHAEIRRRLTLIERRLRVFDAEYDAWRRSGEK